MNATTISLDVTGGQIAGDLSIPEGALGLVIFAHGSGSSRHSPRNKQIAAQLQEAGIATFLMDLLTEREEDDYSNRFNIDLLSGRLLLATMELKKLPEIASLPIAYFGASTGAAAALHASAWLPDVICAVVSRGGRPDLAQTFLPEVKAPTLLIVGEFDHEVLALNRQALSMLHGDKELVTVRGASHLFEEEGTLHIAGNHARDWFLRYFKHASKAE